MSLKNILFSVFTAFLISLSLITVPVLAQEVDPSPSPEVTTQPSPSQEPSTTPEPSVSPSPSPEPTANQNTNNSSTPEATDSATITPTPSQETTTNPAPSASPSPFVSASPRVSNWVNNSDGSVTSTTPVVVNQTYTAPQNSNVLLKFTQLPASAGDITIRQLTLSAQQLARLGTAAQQAYEFVTSMANGTFQYDLTLPYQDDNDDGIVDGLNIAPEAIAITYSEDGVNFTRVNQSQITVHRATKTITVSGLNHFTIFAVTNPNTQANCDSVSLGTTAGTTCFATIQEAINAASNGDTIEVNPGSYSETLVVNKNLTLNGNGSTVDAIYVQASPVTITGFTGPIYYPDVTPPVVSGLIVLNVTTGNGAYVKNGDVIKLRATITDNNQSSITAAMITADLSALGLGSAVPADSYDPITGLAMWNTIAPIVSSGNGTVSLVVHAVDAANNTAITNSISVTSDNTTPNAPSAGASDPVNSGNNTSISVFGVGEANTTVTVTFSDGVNPNVVASGTVTTTGDIILNNIDISSLNDGTITVSVVLTDTAGNASAATTFTITKDIVAPTLSVRMITSNNANPALAKTGDTVSLGFTAAEAITNVVVIIAGHSRPAINTVGNNWLATYTLVGTDSEGVVSFSIDYEDLYGNSGSTVTTTTDSSSVTFDRTAPVAPVVTATNPINNANKTNISISGTGEANTGVSYAITDGANPAITGSSTVSVGGVISITGIDLSSLNDGTLTITVTLTDAAGNISAVTTVTVTKDTVAPVVSAGSNQTRNSSFTQTGTATDAAPSSGGLTYSWSQTAGPGVITFGTQNALSTTISADTDGTYTIQLTVTDAAGNTATSTMTLIWDTVAPTFSSVNIHSNNSTPTIAFIGNAAVVTFTASETLSTVTMTIAGHSVIPNNAGGNTWSGTWIITSTDNYGVVPFTISVTDLAGNVSATITAVTDTSSLIFMRSPQALTSGIPSSSGGSSNSGPQIDAVPGSTVTLATNAGVIASTTEVVLTWQKAKDPLTHYALVFGRSADKMEYGSPDIGDKNTTSYKVRFLTPGVTYYFRIVPVNGKTTGTPSAVIVLNTRTGITRKAVNQVARTFRSVTQVSPAFAAEINSAVTASPQGEIDEQAVSTMAPSAKPEIVLASPIPTPRPNLFQRVRGLFELLVSKLRF